MSSTLCIALDHGVSGSGLRQTGRWEEDEDRLLLGASNRQAGRQTDRRTDGQTDG